MNDHTLKEEIVREICEVLAKYEPFSLDELMQAYDELVSIDRLIYAIEIAKRQQCPLKEVVESDFPVQHVIPSQPYSPGTLAKVPPSRTDSGRKARAKVNLGFKIKVKP
mgnify:CR=1 FL=1